MWVAYANGFGCIYRAGDHEGHHTVSTQRAIQDQYFYRAQRQFGRRESPKATECRDAQRPMTSVVPSMWAPDAGASYSMFGDWDLHSFDESRRAQVRMGMSRVTVPGWKLSGTGHVRGS